MGDLPDEVMDRAVWKAKIAAQAAEKKWAQWPRVIADAVEAAAPILIEAERKRIKAVLTSEEMADLLFDLYEANEDRHRFGNLAMGAALRRAVLSVIDEGKEA